MARTSLTGYQRQYGVNKSATPNVTMLVAQMTIDPTATPASTGITLPKGCIVNGVQNVNGGATGGTNPTVFIGISGDTDGFSGALDADGATAIVNTGALNGIELTADTIIFAGVGASAATGGSVTAILTYYMVDDGSA